MRTWVCVFLAGFFLPVAAAQAATLRIEQRDANGQLIDGGCYRAASEDDLRDGCATDGVVVLDHLIAGTFTVSEYRKPPGYRATADFTVTLADGETETRARRHEATPRLNIVTPGTVGSCWRVHLPDDHEGFTEACDADADGTTTFLDIPEG